MTRCCSLFTLIVLTLLALASRAEAQLNDLAYAAPDAFFVDLDNPNTSAAFHCASDFSAGRIELRFGDPRGSLLAINLEPSLRISDQDVSVFLNGEFYVAFDESVAGDGIAGRVGPCWSGAQANGDRTLCLTNDRFRVDVAWQNSAGATGSGTGAFAGQNGDTGLFRFATPDNWELLVKVLDACAVEGVNSFGVFAAGLTNVEVDITVTDTQTDQVKTYLKPLGTPFQPIQDTTAFATCP